MALSCQHAAIIPLTPAGCPVYSNDGLRNSFFLFSARARGRFNAQYGCDRARAENKKVIKRPVGFYKQVTRDAGLNIASATSMVNRLAARSISGGHAQRWLRKHKDATATSCAHQPALAWTGQNLLQIPHYPQTFEREQRINGGDLWKFRANELGIAARRDNWQLLGP